MRLGLVPLALMAGCTLVDQNTFNPHARDAPFIPPAPVVAAVPPGPPPLVTIPLAAQASYVPTLRRAVADARRRKPNVVFDVVEIEPPDTPPDAPMGAEAAAVARTIVGEGVAPDRVRLVARPEAGASAREVRVYVR